MSLHSYSSVVKRIDKRGGPLEKYLAVQRHPMVLRSMNRPPDVSLAIQQGVKELAARTARCYHAFSTPIVARSQQRANAERLRWVQTYSLREFKYCVALQDAVAKFVAEGGVESLRRGNGDADGARERSMSAAASPSAGTETEVEASGASGGALTAPPHTRRAAPRACFLRNTDDRSFVDEVAAAAAAAAAATPGGGSANPGLATVQATVETSPTSVVVSRGRRLSREQAELGLETGDAELLDLPFDLALEMLRPQESFLDLLVNEAPLQSEHLNTWFSRFCRRRVAWRVLHEHLLHLTRPDMNAPVVQDATDVMGILQGAANAVADIYTKLNVCDHELVLHIEEDRTVLTTLPNAAYVSSSVDCITRTMLEYRAGMAKAAALPAPPASDTVFSVEGHLAYVFREILKNACVATLRWTSDLSVTIRFAADERWVVVDIVDHAGGISPEHMRNIWKFGWTTSEHYESHLGGFGVGVPTSKVYMDMWGGSVDVFSTVGKGTTVRVRYPRAPTEVLVPDISSDTAAAPPGGSAPSP